MSKMFFPVCPKKSKEGHKKDFYRMPVLQGNQQPGRTGEADLLLQPGCCVVEPTVQAKDHSRHSQLNSCRLMWSTILLLLVSILILRESPSLSEEKEGDKKIATFKSENYEGIKYVSNCFDMRLPVL